MNPRKFIHFATGLLSCTPLLNRLQRGTRGTISARYCYSVWLRHLVVANRNGLSRIPAAIAELGPGDSLGIGLAGLLCGANRYYALEAFHHSNPERNLAVLDELVKMFRRREPIPDDDEFPLVSPKLDSYAFPAQILGDDHLSHCLKDTRVATIRDAVRSIGANTETNRAVQIKYVVPWNNSSVIEPATVDFLYSQAVLEHVEDLEHTYHAMHSWLTPGGFISHQVDFKCHNTANRWNGHWTVPEIWWKLLRGHKPYLLNRMPHSHHLRLLRDSGFQLVTDTPIRRHDGYPRSKLSPRFQWLSDDDLVTSGAHILAKK